MPSAGHLRCARVRNVSRTRSAVARGVRTLESVAGHVRASSSMCDEISITIEPLGSTRLQLRCWLEVHEGTFAPLGPGAAGRAGRVRVWQNSRGYNLL